MVRHRKTAVNIQKLATRLQKEAQASPGKAAMLAVMLLAALYFWAPLAGKLLGGKAPPKPPGSPVVATAGVAPITPISASSSVPQGEDALRWDRIRRLIAADSRMRSASFNPQWHNPFTIDAPPVEQEDLPTTEIPAADSAPPPVDPQAAGLALTSVMVGKKARSAVINGRVLRENETLEVVNPAGSGLLTYRITKINDLGVQLEIAGTKQQLALPRKTWAKK